MIQPRTDSVIAPTLCAVCGGSTFVHTPVLWPELVDAWGISAGETAYIDAQQGTHCDACGSNLRSIALARALMRWRGFAGLLRDFVADPAQRDLRVLEINEAGTLHPLLQQLPSLRYGAYPQMDMMRLPFADGSFDVVIHSDTLEHVPDPAKGLAECHRVLHADGALVFTVPTVLARLTRGRAGLPASYHGNPDQPDPQMLVHTEFGADGWVLVLAAGFSSCELVPYAFPAGMAIIARR